MKISHLLAPYLQLNKKIGLTGIGTLSLKHFNGFLETETNMLYPARVHLIFEETEILNTNFASYISISQKITITEAQLQLSNWLLNIKAELINGNSYLLEKIGLLKLENQKIQFTSFEDAYFNQASFGFKPQLNIVLNDINFNDEDYINSDNNFEKTQEIEINKEENVVELSINKIEAEPLPLPYPTITSPIKAPNITVSKAETPNEVIITNAPKQKTDWFWIIAIILVCLTGAIVCATFIYFPPFKPKEITEVPLKLDKTKADSLADITTQPDTTVTYEIIVAENLTPVKAQKQLLKLKAMGIYGHLITNDSNMIVQVSVERFLHIDSAQAKLKQIQQKYYPKAYLKTTTEIN